MTARETVVSPGQMCSGTSDVQSLETTAGRAEASLCSIRPQTRQDDELFLRVCVQSMSSLCTSLSTATPARRCLAAGLRRRGPSHDVWLRRCSRGAWGTVAGLFRHSEQRRREEGPQTDARTGRCCALTFNVWASCWKENDSISSSRCSDLKR